MLSVDASVAEGAANHFKEQMATGQEFMMKAMGMKLPFTATADFSKMTKDGGLMIGAVLHKAFVDVDVADLVRISKL